MVRHDTEGYDLALLSFSIGDCLDDVTWYDLAGYVVTVKDTDTGKARVVAMTKDVSLTERRKGQIEGNQYSVHDKEPLCDQLFNFESLLHLDPPR